MPKPKKPKNIIIRYILNSNANKAIEAEVWIEGNFAGRASSPAAILPGKRERKFTSVNDESIIQEASRILDEILINKVETQEEVDSQLSAVTGQVGTDITLAVSLAYARAVAASENIDLEQYIFELIYSIDRTVLRKKPIILIPVFSGGVHQKGDLSSFQQVMLGICEDTLMKSYKVSKEISSLAEKRLFKENLYGGIASSGGFVTLRLSTEDKLDLAKDIIRTCNAENNIILAVDIAAEHLKKDNGYMLDDHLYSSNEFYLYIKSLIDNFNINYVEDPFDTDDPLFWKQLRKDSGRNKQIIGDDLFATQRKYIDSQMASGAVVKMNQVGNLSDTLKMVQLLHNQKMSICVSHRSYETEDTGMCDLATAIGAEYIKIGGVKRGERIIKYNQLLRLEKKWRADING